MRVSRARRLYECAKTHQVIRRLSQQRVNEITRPKRPRHQRRHMPPIRRLHPHPIPHMREHLAVAHRHQRELAKVRVRGEVLERVQRLAEEAVRLVELGLAAAAPAPAEVDAAEEGAADEGLGGVPMPVFVRDVVLHARVRVYFQFAGL